VTSIGGHCAQDKRQPPVAYDIYSVEKGESANIIVDLISPDKPGNYSTNLTIVSGNTVLCNLNANVTVTQ
jgi:hypothetical protein